MSPSEIISFELSKFQTSKGHKDVQNLQNCQPELKIRILFNFMKTKVEFCRFFLEFLMS